MKKKENIANKVSSEIKQQQKIPTNKERKKSRQIEVTSPGAAVPQRMHTRDNINK